jgi:hypothetical protein
LPFYSGIFIKPSIQPPTQTGASCCFICLVIQPIYIKITTNTSEHDMIGVLDFTTQMELQVPLPVPFFNLLCCL